MNEWIWMNEWINEWMNEWMSMKGGGEAGRWEGGQEGQEGAHTLRGYRHRLRRTRSDIKLSWYAKKYIFYTLLFKDITKYQGADFKNNQRTKQLNNFYFDQ